MRNQYFVKYRSDKYNRMMFNREAGEYGCYEHDGGNASSLRVAKSHIRYIRQEYANENPRDFRVYDSLANIDEATGYVPCVYAED